MVSDKWSGFGWFFGGGSLGTQALGSIILMHPFEPGTFYDSYKCENYSNKSFFAVGNTLPMTV